MGRGCGPHPCCGASGKGTNPQNGMLLWTTCVLCRNCPQVCPCHDSQWCEFGTPSRGTRWRVQGFSNAKGIPPRSLPGGRQRTRGEADPDLGAPVVILCLLYINSSSSKAALPLWISLIFPMLIRSCGTAKGVGGRRLPVFAEMNNLGVCFLSVDKCLLMPALPPVLSTDCSGASGQSAIGVRTNKRARVGCQKCSA